MKVLLLSSASASGERMIKDAGGRSQTKESITGIWPVTELLVIGSMLKNIGLDVELIDANVLGWLHDRVVQEVKTNSPDVVIILSITPLFYDDLQLASKIKSIIKDVKIVFYGIHVTRFPNEVTREEIDFIVRGEPELTIQELCETLKNNGEFRAIAGLSYSNNGEISHNPDRPLIQDLDILPPPSLELMDPERYRMPASTESFMVIQTTRGCPYSCIFCTSESYYGKKWRTRSPKSIIEEIRLSYEKYYIKNFNLMSDLFTFDRERVIDLCKHIIDSGINIKWTCNSRVDKVDEELLRKMKEAGCWLMSFGIESGDPQMLKNMKKGTTIEQAEKAVNLAKKVGIEQHCYFIIGLPGETRESALRTIIFAKRLNPTYVKFYVGTPLPGSEFFELAVQNKWINWDDFVTQKKNLYEGLTNMISYPDFSNEEIVSYVKRGYREFYFRPKFILREFKKVKNLNGLIERFKIFRKFMKNWF